MQSFPVYWEEEFIGRLRLEYLFERTSVDQPPGFPHDDHVVRTNLQDRLGAPTSHFEMYSLAAQTAHRNRETRGASCSRFHGDDFTEVVFEPMANRLSRRTGLYLFLVMSLSGRQVFALSKLCRSTS